MAESLLFQWHKRVLTYRSPYLLASRLFVNTKNLLLVGPSVWICYFGDPPGVIAGSFKVTHQHQLCFLIESQDLPKLLLCLWQLLRCLIPYSPPWDSQ
jgi:hypothetical protein